MNPQKAYPNSLSRVSLKEKAAYGPFARETNRKTSRVAGFEAQPTGAGIYREWEKLVEDMLLGKGLAQNRT